jgi:hypothetical protein
MFNLIKFLFNLIIIGRLPKTLKEIQEAHIHRFAKWRVYCIKVSNKATFSDVESANMEIMIQRICSECGHTEYKSFYTPWCVIGSDLDNATEELLKYLNETIMYVPPKPAPKPEPIRCHHDWTKRGIVSESSDEDRYETDTYDDEAYQVASDMDKLRKHITSTIIAENNKVSEKNILECINEFANGVEFIEVKQCDKLAKKIYTLIS